MNTPGNANFLERAHAYLEKCLKGRGLLDAEVSVRVGVLTPEEAIGRPLRTDFPIVVGKENMVEATFQSVRGQAFTDAPGEFSGTVREILDLPLNTNQHRAIFVAVLNAVLCAVGSLGKTVHCKDEDPEHCAVEMAEIIQRQHGGIRVGLVGCNPAIAEAMAETFGVVNVSITDLNPDNIGKEKFGVLIKDGNTGTEEMIAQSDLVVLTGTTFINDTFIDIWKTLREYDKDYLVYGVTASGLCHIFGLKGICPYGRDGE